MTCPRTTSKEPPPMPLDVRPHVQALIARGRVTLDQLNALRLNSYEWSALVPALDDEAFLTIAHHALNNTARLRGSVPTTYEDACVHTHLPEALRRLQAEVGLDPHYGERATERLRPGASVHDSRPHPYAWWEFDLMAVEWAERQGWLSVHTAAWYLAGTLPFRCFAMGLDVLIGSLP